jgi:hypothetical protein
LAFRTFFGVGTFRRRGPDPRNSRDFGGSRRLTTRKQWDALECPSRTFESWFFAPQSSRNQGFDPGIVAADGGGSGIGPNRVSPDKNPRDSAFEAGALSKDRPRPGRGKLPCLRTRLTGNPARLYKDSASQYNGIIIRSPRALDGRAFRLIRALVASVSRVAFFVLTE